MAAGTRSSAGAVIGLLRPSAPLARCVTHCSRVSVCAHALAIGLALGAFGSAVAQTPPPTTTEPAEGASAGALDQTRTEPAAEPAPGGVLSAARRSLHSTSLWLARGIDSWFGDIPFEKGGSVTKGRLGINLLRREDDGTTQTIRFSAQLRLPNIEQQAYAFIGRDNVAEEVADTPAAVARSNRLQSEAREDQAFFAGLGVRLDDNVDFRVGLRGGLKPYAQARYRKPWRLGPRDLLEFRETVFWTSGDGFGSTTTLTYERTLTPSLSARWLSTATVTQDSRMFGWNSVLGTYWDVDASRQLALEAVISGRQNDPVPVTEYGLQARWAQPLHTNDLLGEVLLGHYWPRRDVAFPRSTSWAVGANIKLLF
jgi:hypothetical protein